MQLSVALVWYIQMKLGGVGGVSVVCLLCRCFVAYDARANRSKNVLYQALLYNKFGASDKVCMCGTEPTIRALNAATLA